MIHSHLKKLWNIYVEFSDKEINKYYPNEYILNHYFFHPTTFNYNKLREIKKVSELSFIDKLKLRLNFYISLILFVSKKPYFKLFENRYYKKIFEEIIKKKYDYVFVSHLNNKDQLFTTNDPYFGDLPELLSKKNIKVLLILIPHCEIKENDFRSLKQNINSYDTYILSNNFLEEDNIFEEIIKVTRERRRLLKASKNNSDNKLRSNLYYYAAEKLFSRDNQNTLLQAKQVSKIISKTFPKNIITTYEGHGWERLFYFFAKKGFKKIKCLGYQHTLIFEKNHSVKRELKDLYNPDYILTSGILSSKIIRKNFSKDIKVKVLGGTKFNKKNKTADKLNIHENILFLPSGEEEEALFFTNFAINFAKIYPTQKIIIRYHPLIKNKFKDIANLYNLKVSKNTIENDCRISRWAIYSSSTAIFEAINYGCIPINLRSKMLINFNNPLWQIKSDLIKEIRTFKNLSSFIVQTKRNAAYETELNCKYNMLLKEMNYLICDLNESIIFDFKK
tara:strand:- start:212 stop:1726 length:1515 start_codon:yes stop_codon:yes gene_type:complete